MALVEVQHFSYTYPGEHSSALRNLDLSIEQGAFVVITGKSGCGKSTLGKALAGFLFQDEEPNYSGQILVNGLDMAFINLYEASERVAYVQQNPEDQFCTLTVMDEIAFGLENLCKQPDEINQKIDKVLSPKFNLIHRKLERVSDKFFIFQIKILYFGNKNMAYGKVKTFNFNFHNITQYVSLQYGF